MKRNLKNQEKGSVLIEIIAVVALLGVMGPLLFKQVSDRNEEIENINIASEIRIMKEAFSSYIMNFHSEILEGACSNATVCDPVLATVQSYLPAGFETTMGGYTFKILKSSDKRGSSTLQGFIIPNLGDLNLQALSLKRVARIATLIGADGGILRKGTDTINGTGGAWSLATEKLTGITFPDTDHYFLATTGIDTFVPTVRYEDFDQSNILMPTDGFANRRLHAWNYFSVGQGDAGASNTCFQLNHNSIENGTSQSDAILNAGESGCDPLFWVAADGSEFAGNVYVKNALHFLDNPSGRTSVLISSGTTAESPTVALNKNRKIVVYTSNGQEAVVINGQGEIVATSATHLDASDSLSGNAELEKLTIKNGRIETNAKAIKATADAGSNQAYKVDPRFISVMGDIRLESRGGAKLSDLLPTYQLKNITNVTTNYIQPENPIKTFDIPMPSCPNEHVPAIMVMPVRWHQSTEKEIIDIITQNVVSQEGGTLAQNATKTPEPSQYPILPEVTISAPDTDDTNYYHKLPNDKTPDKWTVKLEYTQNGTTITETSTTTPIFAIVHTYCVYTGDQNTILERANDDTSVTGQ